jgi:hypothetical protein
MEAKQTLKKSGQKAAGVNNELGVDTFQLIYIYIYIYIRVGRHHIYANLSFLFRWIYFIMLKYATLKFRKNSPSSLVNVDDDWLDSTSTVSNENKASHSVRLRRVLN